MSMSVDLTKQPASRFGSGIPGLLVPTPNGNSQFSVRYSMGTDTVVSLSTAGSGNQISRSKTRGIDWASIAEPATRQWTGLATDGRGRWVAVAQNGLAAGMAMYSEDDALIWNSASMPNNNAWQDVCWAGGYGDSARFVAVAYNGAAATQVAISTDGGKNWRLSNGGAPVGRSWHGINFGNNVLVMVAFDGAGDQTARSTNGGDNWTSIPESITRMWYSVCYSPVLGVWLACALQNDIWNVMYSNNDVLSWTTATCQTNLTSWCECCWGDDRFLLAAGNEGSVGISPNGRVINHVADSDPGMRMYYSVCWARDRFVVVGNIVRIC